MYLIFVNEKGSRIEYLLAIAKQNRRKLKERSGLKNSVLQLVFLFLPHKNLIPLSLLSETYFYYHVVFIIRFIASINKSIGFTAL